MIAVDTNLLVYAHRSESAFHHAAFKCLADLAQGKQPWAIAWPCLHEFYSVATHPRIYNPPTPIPHVCRQIMLWTGSPHARVIAETPSHWATLQRLLLAGDIKGGMVHDARIAAICLDHGVREFWTADRDFSRFPQLKCLNPLIPVG